LKDVGRMSHRLVFPFPAVVGQEQVKTALLVNAVNPKAGGVLIAGEKGVAKSTLVRGLTGLLVGMTVIDLPLNATEDRVIGSIDIEHAIATGKKRLDPGLLAKADGNILYIDEVNLLSDSVTSTILDVAASGFNIVEREGISFQHKAKFILVGTMNPEEGQLSPQFLDRFGLYVQVEGGREVAARKEIIRRRLEYERDAGKFCRCYSREITKLRQQIIAARNLLSTVQVTEDMMEFAARIAQEANCAGHRADIFLVETARAITALAGRSALLPADLREAAKYVLPHRMRLADHESASAESDNSDRLQEKNNKDKQLPGHTISPEAVPPVAGPECRSDRVDGSSGAVLPESREDSGESFGVRDIVFPIADGRLRKGSGRRSVSRTGTKQGRYVKFVLPKGKVSDLAFDATLRAAAPFQSAREKRDTLVAIRTEDFRQKVREKRIGNTILFVVDASGSMGARQRMRAVKGAILSLLSDAYQKRDRVGLIVFRHQMAEVVLGITRSIDLARKRLQALPTGGKTPLALGLRTGLEVLRTAGFKDPEIAPALILVTDGKANVAVADGDPVQEALAMAAKVRGTGIPSVVIDTENDFIRLELAREIAQAMQAQYYRLEELQAEGIAQAVRSSIWG
jgi:magnesium chelatase subunit D